MSKATKDCLGSQTENNKDSFEMEKSITQMKK